MFDFTSGFWTWWIIFFSVGGLIGCAWLVYWMSPGALKGPGEVQTMGHVWDETLAELDNPLPRWWLLMFYGLIVIALVYLLLYPGLGAFRGFLGWTNASQYEGEVQQAEERFKPVFDRYAREDLAVLAKNPEAMQSGGRLFQTYCAVCHGTDAHGAKGFPNLTDGDWLWGGDPPNIEATILDGRQASMPSWETILGKEGVYNVVEHVRSLSGKEVDKNRAASGKTQFAQACAGCHGPEGKGNPAMGAPDLTDSVWLYGGSHDEVLTTVRQGRQGRMPAFKDFLGDSKGHLLAAYVYSLSHK
jgi:cytochrome c oxidase cbb3-type subunit 3